MHVRSRMAWGAPDGLMQSDFTRRMAFPKQTVNLAVVKMQGDGLVALESAEGSRKEKSVRLTDTGRTPMMTAAATAQECSGPECPSVHKIGCEIGVKSILRFDCLPVLD